MDTDAQNGTLAGTWYGVGKLNWYMISGRGTVERCIWVGFIEMHKLMLYHYKK